jgi:hypothetical protein
MLARSITLLALGAAIGFAASTSNLAVRAQERAQLGSLNVSEGIYVDPKTFNIVKGTSKTDPTAHMAKLGALEVKSGAIIVRAGDKLYLVDTDPAVGKSFLYSGWAAEAFSGAGQP